MVELLQASEVGLLHINRKYLSAMCLCYVSVCLRMYMSVEMAASIYLTKLHSGQLFLTLCFFIIIFN